MRCLMGLPSLSLASRMKTALSSCTSPTKSRYDPLLSTQVCFHLPDGRSKLERLMPCSDTGLSASNNSWITQLSRVREILLVPLPAGGPREFRQGSGPAPYPELRRRQSPPEQGVTSVCT